MTRLERQLLGALKAMVKAETAIAKNSFREYDHRRRRWVFNDDTWRRNDPFGWPNMARARKAIAAAEARK